MISLTNLKDILFTACEQGDFQTIKTHVQSLSSSEIFAIRDQYKSTLVHYVCRYGHLDILKYFLDEKHVDIHQYRTEHGATCVHDASVCNQVHILQFLFNLNNFSTKFRWSTRDEQGNTPLHLAAKYNCIQVLEYLLNDQLADPSIQSYNGFQPIHYACQHGNIQSLKILLSKSAHIVNKQTNQLLTPMHLASKNGSLETIQILIGHGANIQLRNQNGLNALHFACKYSHFHIVQWLIEKQSANINEVDYQNLTPLHFAAQCGNENIVSYLLDRNGTILRDQFGNTPLHVAAENGHQNICAILIERACCSLTDVNHHRLTAADLADYAGFHSLGNQLRLTAKSPIQIENASIVRLVIKKRNVPRCDAANQVYEEDLLQPHITNENSSLAKRTTISTSTSSHFDKVNHSDPSSSVVAISKSLSYQRLFSDLQTNGHL